MLTHELNFTLKTSHTLIELKMKYAITENLKQYNIIDNKKMMY